MSTDSKFLINYGKLFQAVGFTTTNEQSSKLDVVLNQENQIVVNH